MNDLPMMIWDNAYPFGRAIGSNGPHAPLAFYDTALFEQAKEECGFGGLIIPVLEEPFSARWSEDAWSRILSKGFEIMGRTEGVAPWKSAKAEQIASKS
jgi:hypothetical protein